MVKKFVLVLSLVFGLMFGLGSAAAQAPAQQPGLLKQPQLGTKKPAASPAARLADGQGVAAVVNDQVISTWDVRQRSGLILVGAGIRPSPEALAEVRPQALRSLIEEVLKLQETGKRKIEISEQQIDRELADIARSNNTTVQELELDLRRNGIGIDTLRQQIRAEIAWGRLMSGLYGWRIRISDVQIRDTMERMSANAGRTQYLISEILLAVDNPSQLDEAEAAGKRLVSEITNGAPFQLVARQFSGAPSAAAGGDLGWLALSELRPELREFADSLQKGQLAGPIRTESGMYLLLLRDKREGQAGGAAIRLRKVSAPLSQREQLRRGLGRLNSCNKIDATLDSVRDVQITDLGEQREQELSGDVQTKLKGLKPGQSTPLEVEGERIASLVVCERVATAGASREDVENRLRNQELGMLAERHLRNLRREATILYR